MHKNTILQIEPKLYNKAGRNHIEIFI